MSKELLVQDTEFNPLTEVIGAIGEVTLGGQGSAREDGDTRFYDSSDPSMSEPVTLELLEPDTLSN